MSTLTTSKGRARTDRAPRSNAIRTAMTLGCAAVLLWGLLCGVGWLLTRPLHHTALERRDGAIDRWFAQHRSAGWNTATHIATYAAETVTVAIVAAVFFVGLRLYLHRWTESVFLAVTVVGEVTIFVCTTLLIDRSRPAVPHLDQAPPTSSFPSGHTAAAVALYGGLAVIALAASGRSWLRRLAVTAAVLVPIMVALARMYRGMHYPTDVLGGALLGLAWLAIVRAGVLRNRARP